MNSTKIQILMGVVIAILVIDMCHARTINCSYLCSQMLTTPYCDCSVKLPFRWGKRSTIKLPFRYGKRAYSDIYEDSYDNYRQSDLANLAQLLQDSYSDY